MIGKALEKDRSLRYQHASDMRTDLLRVKRDSESGRYQAARSGTAVTSSQAAALQPSGAMASPSSGAVAVAVASSSGVQALEALTSQLGTANAAKKRWPPSA